MQGDMARYSDIWRDKGRCGEVWIPAPCGRRTCGRSRGSARPTWSGLGVEFGFGFGFGFRFRFGFGLGLGLGLGFGLGLCASHSLIVAAGG